MKLPEKVLIDKIIFKNVEMKNDPLDYAASYGHVSPQWMALMLGMLHRLG